MSADGHRTGTGVALGHDRIVARVGDGEWSRTLEPLGDGPRWPALAAALGELREACAATGGRAPGGAPADLAIALLPPLARVRPLELPPMRPAELRRLVTRNAARYFLGAREPQVVGLDAPRRARGGPGVPALAAAADARLVDAAHEAAREAGWRVRAIVPAEAAWRAAALALWPALAAGEGDVVVAQGERTDLLRLRDGRLAGVRRFRAAALDAGAIRAALDDRGAAATDRAVAVLGDDPMSLGAGLPAPGARLRALAASPDLAAAAFASRGAGLELVPEHAWRVRRGRLWRRTAAVAGAAAALLALAGALRLAGVERELRTVRRERAALRVPLAGVLEAQEIVRVAGRRLEELAVAPRRSPAWSEVLAALSAGVPPDAHLTAVRGQGDTLVIEGVAPRTADVFDALGGVPSLADVRSAAPVRRDFRGDGEERFVIAARVLGVEPAPAATAARAPGSRRP